MTIDISLASVAYLGATILFVLCLGGLSNQETSRRGNLYGMIGMAIAVHRHDLRAAGHARGLSVHPRRDGRSARCIGLYAARKVQMTQMPELVALMHSLVGLAAMLVGYANFIDPAVSVGLTPAENTIHEIEMYLGVLIGAVTFSGSVIAFGKLSAKISGKPVLLPGRHWLNLAGLLLVIYFGYRFVNAHSRRRRHDADDRDDGRRAPVRRAHGDGDRRRRHAGRGVDAEQLLGLGGGGDRLHAEQRPPDRRRRAGRQQRRDPLVHHVQRDEPQLPRRHRRRLRHRRRRAARPRARARSPPAR